MKRVLALGMALLMLIGVSACAGGGSNASNGASNEGRIVVTNIEGAASTSDPFNHSNVNDRIWQGNVFEPLFSYNGHTKEYDPRVGKEFTVSEDGLTYRVTLFDNVYFHNGDKCDAAAVKAAIEYGQQSGFNALYSGGIERMEVVDEHTLDIILDAPNSAFMHNADRIFIMNTKVAEEQGDAFGTRANLAGTGAFYIDHYDPAVEVRLVKWDKFHRGEPKIDGITYKIMTDASAALIAFEAGDLDFINDMPAANFKALEDSGKFTTYLGQTTQSIHYLVNPRRNDTLANKKLRQAMAYATDFEAVNIGSMEGLCDVNGKLMYAPSTIAAPTGGIIYEYDPEKAKELLVEAGFPDGVDVGPITCIAGHRDQKIAEILMEYWGQVGIKASVQPMEQVTTINEMRAGNYGIGVMSIYNMLDMDYMALMVDEVTNPGTGMVKIIESPGIDWERIHELFQLGREESDVDKRREYYTEIDDLVMDAALYIPLFHTALPYAWDKDLQVNTQKSYTYQLTHLWDGSWK